MYSHYKKQSRVTFNQSLQIHWLREPRKYLQAITIITIHIFLNNKNIKSTFELKGFEQTIENLTFSNNCQF